MAYDSLAQATVLFGGQNDDQRVLDDFWSWDGDKWDELQIAGPQARRQAAMVYATDSHRMLLHGGSNGSSVLADTWEFITPANPMGDVNCDCQIDSLDIEPLLVALFDPAGYPALYPDCDILLADINSDGSVNALDIEPFIELLFSP